MLGDFDVVFGQLEQEGLARDLARALLVALEEALLQVLEGQQLDLGFPQVALNACFVVQRLDRHLVCFEVDQVLVVLAQVK